MNEAAFAVGMSTMSETVVSIFVLGFIIHLVMVFLMPKKDMKNVYLTAHMMLYLAVFLALSINCILGLQGMPLIVTCAILAALYWTFTPAIPRALGKKYFGEDFTLGHAQQFGTLIGALCGKLFSKHAEDEDAHPGGNRGDIDKDEPTHGREQGERARHHKAGHAKEQGSRPYATVFAAVPAAEHKAAHRKLYHEAYQAKHGKRP